MGDDGEPNLRAITNDEAARGGFVKGNRPGPPAIILTPVGRTRTGDDERAFRRRVAKRRKAKGYA